MNGWQSINKKLELNRYLSQSICWLWMRLNVGKKDTILLVKLLIKRRNKKIEKCFLQLKLMKNCQILHRNNNSKMITKALIHQWAKAFKVLRKTYPVLHLNALAKLAKVLTVRISLQWIKTLHLNNMMLY